MYKRASEALKWLHKMEHPEGGVCHDAKGDSIMMKPYPEVTGYLIPTLMQWEQYQLAERFAKWLVKTQDSSGGWRDPLHHALRTFDTAMIIDGLRYLSDKRYLPAVNQGLDFLRDNLGPDGIFYTTPMHKETASYTLKVNATMGLRPEWFLKRMAESEWPFLEDNMRLHYIAYACEGLRDMLLINEEDSILRHFRTQHAPFAYTYVRGYRPASHVQDICGNLQMSILLQDPTLLEAMEKHQAANGAMPLVPYSNEYHPWTMKYFLDALTSFGYNDCDAFTDEDDDDNND